MGFDRWKRVNSQIVFHERYIRVRKDDLESPLGEQTDYVYLEDEIPGTVSIVAHLEDGRFLLVYQYRYPVQSKQYNLPGGVIDPGETIQEAARRELQEETGYTAGEWIYAGMYHPMPSHHTRRAHLFVAKDLTRGEQHLDPFEDIHVELFTFQELTDKIINNEITDMELIFGLLLCKQKGLI
ncbi:MAG TPA: NUDIX hydrolase [Bacillota bacterium]|nr:NUDIX hydrolase [Bacillota bacterium]